AALRAVRSTPVRNALSGTWLGHPVHPMLVSMPVGAWGLSSLFDLVGGRNGDRASAALIAAGLLTAVPTAVTGMNDWSDTKGAAARVGLVHATANSAASSLFLGSLVLRMRGRAAAGKAASWAGLALAAGGGYLGGHLTYRQATNVNHAVGVQVPSEWTRVADEADLHEGAMLPVHAGGETILLHRAGRTVTAISAVCSHMGGPLDDGGHADGQVTCPWHGSRFRLSDGTAARGPATAPQPAFEARIVDGGVDVRAAR